MRKYRSRSERITEKILALGLCLALLPFSPAYANHLIQGETVEAGEAHFDRPDATTFNVIQSSDQAIVNFQSFSTAAGETVNFFQPSSSAAILNRVLGGSASELFGALNANGLVAFVNPSGIVFGPSSSVNVGSLIASTLNISNQNFLNGNYSFTQPAGVPPSFIINEGTIKAAPGGSVALLGGAVENKGTIEARLGSVSFASGKAVTLSFDNQGLISVVVNEGVRERVLGPAGETVKDAVRQAGTVTAPGGKVQITADQVSEVFDHLVNQEGIVEAASLVERNGVIELVSGSGEIRHSGTLRAAGSEENPSGGEIRIFSQGKTTLVPGSLIDVSGAPSGGDAGFIEVSGKTVQFGGRLLGEAAEGFRGGRLLVDPLNIIFDTSNQTAPTDNDSPTPDIAFDEDPDDDTTVQINDIKGFDEARFEATQDITVNAELKMNNNKDLVLRAGRDILLNANVEVRGSSGDMTLTADADFSEEGGDESDGEGTIVQAAGVTLKSGSGNMILQTGSDFTIRTIDGGGSVSITSSAGKLLDDGSAATAIDATTLTLTANASGKGVGTSGALNTNITTLNLNVGSGGATIRDSDSFTLNAPTVASGGSLDIRADDDLTIATNAAIAVTGAGTLTLRADADSSGSGGITMNSGSSLTSASGLISLQDDDGLDLRTVTSTSGNISATSNDDVRIRNSMSTGGTGTITITADNDSSGAGTFVQDSGSDVTTAGGNITITGADNMTLRTVNAGTGDVSITTNGSGTNINDDGDNTTLITADRLTLSSGGRIATTGDNQLDTSINELNATANDGSIVLSNNKALTVVNATSIGSGNDVNLTTTLGNLLVGLISAADDITLTAASAIEESGADAAADLIGDLATLTSVTGIGALGAIETTLASADFSVTGAGAINFSETNALTLTDLDTADGSITVSAGGALTATDVQASGANQDVTLTTTSGDILLGLVSAADDVTLTSAGALEESGADSAADLIGDLATLTSVTGIGALGAIETTLASADFSVTGTGAINVSETDSLTLTDLDTADGSITVSSGGALTATDLLAQGGGSDISLTTTSGNILLGLVNAADDLTLTSAAAIEESGADATNDLTGDLATLQAATGIGALGAIETSLSSLTASVTGAGSISLTEADALTITNASVTTANGNIDITTGGDLTLGLVDAAGAVTLTANGVGSILDANGASNNLSATVDSTLTAAGTIGTQNDPVDVTITNASLSVSALGGAGGASVAVNGTVTPTNTLVIVGNPPGLVLFNGIDLRAVAASTAVLGGAASLGRQILFSPFLETIVKPFTTQRYRGFVE